MRRIKARASSCASNLTGGTGGESLELMGEVESTVEDLGLTEGTGAANDQLMQWVYKLHDPNMAPWLRWYWGVRCARLEFLSQTMKKFKG